MTNTVKIIIGFLLATLASAFIGVSLALIQSNKTKTMADVSVENSKNNDINQIDQRQSEKITKQNESYPTKQTSPIIPPDKPHQALTPQLPIEEQKQFIQGSQYFSEAAILLEQASSQQDSTTGIKFLEEAQKKLALSNNLMKKFSLNSIYYVEAQKYISYIPFYQDSVNQWKSYFSQLETYQNRTYQNSTNFSNNNYIDITFQNRKSVMQKAIKKSVVLTFDDGPSPEYTEKILDILKKYNVKATFFVVGSQVQKHCDILQRIYSEGHEIGNHSYTHRWMAKLSPEEQQQEIAQTQAVIQNCIGYQPRWFRSPYASQNDVTLQIAHQAGLHTALWTIDTQDWKKTSTSKSIIQKALNYQTSNIIIMHDGVEPNPSFQHPEASLSRTNTVQSLETIIQRFKNKGFHFTTISDAFPHN